MSLASRARRNEIAMSEARAKKERLAELKRGHGFRLGNGKHAQREAQRRREEIREIERRAPTKPVDS